MANRSTDRKISQTVSYPLSYIAYLSQLAATLGYDLSRVSRGTVRFAQAHEQEFLEMLKDETDEHDRTHRIIQ